jgi:hypothetical protein
MRGDRGWRRSQIRLGKEVGSARVSSAACASVIGAVISPSRESTAGQCHNRTSTANEVLRVKAFFGYAESSSISRVDGLVRLGTPIAIRLRRPLALFKRECTNVL